MQQPTPQQDLNWILVIERDRERRTERGRKRDGERETVGDRESSRKTPARSIWTSSSRYRHTGFENVGPDIGALITTYTILRVPYYNYR